MEGGFVRPIIRPRPDVRPRRPRRNYAPSVALVLRNGLVDVGGGRFDRADVAVADGRIVAESSLREAERARLHALRGRAGDGQRARALERELVPRALGQPAARALDALLVPGARGAARSRPTRSTCARCSAGSSCCARARRCVVDFLYDSRVRRSLEPVVRAYRDLGLRALIALGDGRPRLPRDGRPRRGPRLARADRPARAREAAVVGRVGAVRAARGRALPPARRRDLDLPGAVRAAALYRRDARRLRGACRRARPADPHPRARDAHAGRVGQRMYGRTLPEHLDAIGFLSPRVCFEHGIWLTPGDIELVRDRGVTVVHNPVSNMKLGSGIARSRAAPPRIHVDTIKHPTCEGYKDGYVIMSGVGGTAPYQYAINTSAFDTARLFPTLPEATYTLHVKDANGCTHDTSVQLIGYPHIIINNTQINGASCFSYRNGAITITATGGVQPLTYQVAGDHHSLFGTHLLHKV